MAAKANKEISVNHEGRQKFIDLLAGNAFTLAYVATQIRAEFSTFDDNYELQYVPPGETSYYSIQHNNTDTYTHTNTRGKSTACE